MKRMISIAFVVALVAIIIGQVAYVFAFDKTQYQQNKDVAHEAAELMRSYGYPEDNPIIRAASDWWWENEYAEKAQYAEEPIHNNDYPVDETEYDQNAYYTPEQYAEYPVACEVWQYLRSDMGLSAPVAAGILGNMMSECGGLTLDLQPYIGGFGYYGLCMWYLEYTNGALYWGSSVPEQLDYLANTVEYYINLDGYYDYFTSIQDPGEAAYYFEIHYERGYYEDSRYWNAYTAYNYFS